MTAAFTNSRTRRGRRSGPGAFDGAVYRGDLYMKPAHLAEYYHNGWGTMSQTYVYASDGATR